MKKRCGCEFSLISKGVMKHWQLVFNKKAEKGGGVGYANVEPKESSLVEGIIYKISKNCRDSLDWFEGYPIHYDRPEMFVGTNDSEFLKCLVYIAQPDWVEKGLKPERWYLTHLLRGEKFLSPNYVSFLKKIETVD